MRKISSIVLTLVLVLLTATSVLASASTDNPTTLSVSPGNFAFSSRGQFGSANDGIDFGELVGWGNMIYLGTYDHASAMTGTQATEQYSSYTQQVTAREGMNQPIVWRINGEFDEEGYLTVSSEYVLDSQPFHGNNDTVDYSTSDIRKWLNNDFLNGAFNGAEINTIMPTTVKANHSSSTVNEANQGIFKEKAVTSECDRVYLPPSNALNTGVSPSGGGIVNELGAKDFLRPNMGVSLFYQDIGINLDSITSSEIGVLRNGISTLEDGSPIRELERFMSTYNHVGAYYASNAFGVAPVVKINPESVLLAEAIASEPLLPYAEVNLNYKQLDQASGQTVSVGSRFVYPDNGNPRFAMRFSAGETPLALEPAMELQTQIKAYLEQQAFTTYKLTLLNPEIKLESLFRDGIALENGGIIQVASGGHMVLSGVASGHNKLYYKIVQEVNGERRIVRHGEGWGDTMLNVFVMDMEDHPLPLGGSYALCVWAQRDGQINSHEGSVPMYFRLNVGG